MKFPSYFRVLILVLLLGACKNSDKENETVFSDVNEYQEYVTELSHGIISTKSDVRVVLNTPVKGWESGEELDSDLLLVSPNTKGKVVALDNRTIAFVPEEGFTQDTEYTFTLMLEDIIKDVPEEYHTLIFGVKTLKQQFNVYTSPIQSYKKDEQFIEGQIRTADVLSLEKAKQLLSVKQNGNDIAVSYSEATEEGTEFHFKIDNIKRLEEDSFLEISWDGAPFNIESAGKNSIVIPGKNNFTVLEAIVDRGDQQLVTVSFSDPLKKGQNFKGLVTLEGDDKVKYSVDGNTLKIYPSLELKDTHKIEIFAGITSADGVKLKNSFTEQLAFEQIKPQVRLLSNGSILPSSHNLKINFETVNLKTVDVTVLKIFENNVLQFLQRNDLNTGYDLRYVSRPIAKKKIHVVNSVNVNSGKWTAHSLDLRNLIEPERGAIYRVEFNYRPSYSLYTCQSTNFRAEEENTDNFDEEEEDSSWDGVEAYAYDDYYYYNWNEREDPCSDSYYYDKTIGINVLASDIGVTVKKGLNKSYFVATNDILNTNPIPGVNVTFYNLQQQPIGNVVTEADGTAIFDANNLAYFAVATLNGQKTYVKLNDGNALSVSKFNVSGVELQKGIKGFIYGERGVWRPGDTIFLTFILNDKANELPANHPVKLELFDPYNKAVIREVKTAGVDNFYDFKLKTDENAPTGNWIAKVSVGGAIFTKSIKIETIKPNRLKIKTNFDDEVLSSSKSVKGDLEVQWLHGAIAKNLKADIAAKFMPEVTSFKQFPGYTFDDPTRTFTTEDQIVFDGKINEQGKASFSVAPQLKGNAPGMLKAAFVTKVYENGGDFSTDVFTKTYSPFTTYIGLNMPKGDKARGMLLTDTKHKFEVVAVDEHGKPKAVQNLKVSIHKVQWRWWWDTSADNLSNFSSSNYREKVFEKTISTNASGKGDFEFELKYPDWGRYLVRVEDPNGGHATGKTIYIDWPGWAGKSRKGDPSSATMLVFSTDKEKYNVGENVTVTFPSSAGARALVTVENGSEVLESVWVETTDGETKFTLPVTELYTPNVFISISLLQPHANSVNDAPIRLYGITGIKVEDKETRLAPEISMPEVLRPEESVTLKVSEKHGKAMTYTIAMVDDGLLDLTRYTTPQPWNTFYAPEALGVKTWDIYDDVIGAFGGKINQVFAIGGDGELAGAKNKKANRFDPMVVYLGPFTLKEGQTKSHQIKIPKYIGSVRTMVIAGNAEKEAYGEVEKTTPVRKPLMVLSSLPRKITPGEQVTLPVTVFAMEKKVKNISVTVKKDKAFTIDGSATQTVSFPNPDEKMVYFNLKVSDFDGIGKVIVEASGNGEKASYEIPIDVVNPNPSSSEVTDVILDGNASKSVQLSTFGVQGTNSMEVELSTLPQMNFNGRLKYLIRYPHGCVEQTTSAAFPQLYLSDIFNLDGNRKSDIQQNVEQAIKSLGAFQLPNGGFSYWPGAGKANDWGTSYAGHFLLEAEKKGYVMPIGFKSSWISYQQQEAKQWRSSTSYSDLSQAYRLYTLALAGSADIASMNRLRETEQLSNEAKFRLAAAYALVGQAGVAKQILNTASIDFKENKQMYYNYGSVSRNEAMALETLSIVKDKQKAQEVAKRLATKLTSDNFMSTQSTAYSLLSMAKFAEMVGGKGIKATVVVNGKSVNVTTEKTLATTKLSIKTGTNDIQINNKEGNVLYVSFINSGVLPVGEEKTFQKGLSAQLVFKGRNGSKIDPSKMMQGTDFVAEVTLTNTTDSSVKNVALTEIFPSGWEIVNTRFTDFGSFAENKVDYTDIRDDRANFYFDLNKRETKTFRVLLNASYLGTYYLPGIQAEGMYDNNFNVRTKGQWVEVVQ